VAVSVSVVFIIDYLRVSVFTELHSEISNFRTALEELLVVLCLCGSFWLTSPPFFFRAIGVRLSCMSNKLRN